MHNGVLLLFPEKAENISVADLPENHPGRCKFLLKKVLCVIPFPDFLDAVLVQILRFDFPDNL